MVMYKTIYFEVRFSKALKSNFYITGYWVTVSVKRQKFLGKNKTVIPIASVAKISVFWE